MRAIALLLAILAVIGCGRLAREPMEGTETWVIDVEGTERTMLVRVPSGVSYPSPLLLAFHGGFGTAAGVEQAYGLSQLADREGFVVVYPQGLDRHWEDGRIDPTDMTDVDFVQAALDTLQAACGVDPGRIWATGMSNGAFFCHYLTHWLPGTLEAIAPVCGGIADPGWEWFAPADPTRVCIIQATDDPMVPYHGGGVGMQGRRGGVMDTDEAVELWLAVNGCSGSGEVSLLPDTDPNDGCAVTLTEWGGDADVALYRMDGAGHAWPSSTSPQYLPERVIGAVCRDIEAPEVLWEFFSSAGTGDGSTPERGASGDGDSGRGGRGR